MSNTDYQEIIYEVTEPVATITMNRPEALNALTGANAR
jgi:enoyl-CoA hydratase/carnithine racemase